MEIMGFVMEGEGEKGVDEEGVVYIPRNSQITTFI